MATPTTRLGLSKPAVTDLIVNFPATDDAALDTLDAGMWIFRGAFNAATAYVVNDVVALNGVLYVAVSPSTGSPPPSAAWAPGAAPGGTYAQAADLTTETARATAAEGANATAIAVETAARLAAPTGVAMDQAVFAARLFG